VQRGSVHFVKLAFPVAGGGPVLAGHTFKRILALDLGKFNSVLCLYDPTTAEHTFASFATTPQAIHDLLAAHAAKESDPSRLLVVMETCDVCGWVYDIALALGLAVAVANASGEAWKWRRVKRKTDRDDALKLARMTAVNQLATVHMPPANMRQRRRLIHHRKTLIERRTISKNQIRSIFSQEGIILPRGTKLWTAAGLAMLSGYARTIDCCEIGELWRGRLQAELHLLAAVEEQIKQVDRKLDELGAADEKTQLLQTAPGVGPRLAEAVDFGELSRAVAHLDDVHRFRNSRTLGAYVGLVPKKLSSGEMDRDCRITRSGPRMLRGMLDFGELSRAVEVAWMVHRYSPWAQEFVARVSHGSKKRKKIAIVALARKLLDFGELSRAVKLWAMLRDGTPWHEPGVMGGTKGEDLAALGRV
jgi:transposase